MMNAAIRFGVLLGLCGLSAACGHAMAPAVPSVIIPAPTAPSRDFVPFPAVTKPARVYVAASFPSAHAPILELLLSNRYVLYEDGTFALQATYTSFEIKGAYKETDGVVAFDFGSGFGGQRGATGSIVGDLLTVKYGEIMHESDFTDGVFRLEVASTSAERRSRAAIR